MNSGAADRALILFTAAFSVPATSGFAGLLNPMWLSLICTKLSSPMASFGLSSGRRVRLYDFNPPPLITQKPPVPAHAIHFKNPRRSIPSWLWSYKISSFFLPLIASLLLNLCLSLQSLSRSARQRKDGAGLQRKGVKPAPCVNVFIGVDPARPGFIPEGVFSSYFFFFHL